jgi:hypothetical protein
MSMYSSIGVFASAERVGASVRDSPLGSMSHNGSSWPEKSNRGLVFENGKRCGNTTQVTATREPQAISDTFM